MNEEMLKSTIEALLLAADRPLSTRNLVELLAGEHESPNHEDVRSALDALGEEWRARGAELVRVASGYRLQVRQTFEPWVARLWEERPPRYSRALLETLALIAYRQPITRAEIEDVRGVSVSSQIVKTLLEREWVQVLGHRDTPGRPAMYGTTRQFLDYFNLKSLDQLPSLVELKDVESMNPELEFDAPQAQDSGAQAAAAGDELH
ncbi:MAG: SMC-Scp complex subunit ScpB [Gammaproteobacteria bacterium]|nr:SMC-Scp complex subunit ScpB [Gammaproteobacteria bacterium]